MALSIRTREGKDLGSKSLDEFISLLNNAINLKGTKAISQTE